MEVEDDLGGQGEDPTQIMSPYEQSRERRIRENLERMRKMGILHITQKLSASSTEIRKRGRPTSSAMAARRRNEDGSGDGGGVPRLTPLRRSSRLQSASPVTYSDVLLSGRASGRTKREKVASAAADKQILLEEGPKTEAYTEEHEKLLGSTEKCWELFVDGYGKDGRRIYDPFKGKTCHQCRQKTLGHRTKCSQCDMVQGQFCGDCLYMRYGEHVLEALENPKWICPACRGICNCSLCRQAKGWAPTGPLYRKISSMGFKSVAHYLIQTRRLRLKLETQTHSDAPAHLSVKRSLPFSNYLDCKEPLEKNMVIKQFHIDSMEKGNSSLTIDRVSAGHLSIKRSLSFISDDNNPVTEEEALGDQIGTEELGEGHRIVVATISEAANSFEQVKKHGSCRKLNQDDIGGGLCSTNESFCLLSDDSHAEMEQPPENQRRNEEHNEGHHILVAGISVDTNSLKPVRKYASCSELNQDSIGGRLRSRKKSLCLLSCGNNAETKQPLDYQRGNEEPNEDHRIVVAAISADANNLKQVKKISSCSEPNQDSTGGRLQPRKNTSCLLSDGNNAKTEKLQDYQRGNEKHDEDHRIVVAAISAASNSFRQVKKDGYCSPSNQDNIGGGPCLRKKSFFLLSDYNHAKMEWLSDYQRGNQDQNEDHRIVVAAISATTKLEASEDARALQGAEPRQNRRKAEVEKKVIIRPLRWQW